MSISSFKFIEYKGEDASDVLVSLLMNLEYPQVGDKNDPEVHDGESVTEVKDPEDRIVGFTANPSVGDDDEDEDEDKDGLE